MVLDPKSKFISIYHGYITQYVNWTNYQKYSNVSEPELDIWPINTSKAKNKSMLLQYMFIVKMLFCLPFFEKEQCYYFYWNTNKNKPPCSKLELLTPTYLIRFYHCIHVLMKSFTNCFIIHNFTWNGENIIRILVRL